jgi:hypothetical protein
MALKFPLHDTTTTIMQNNFNQIMAVNGLFHNKLINQN